MGCIDLNNIDLNDILLIDILNKICSTSSKNCPLSSEFYRDVYNESNADSSLKSTPETYKSHLKKFTEIVHLLESSYHRDNNFNRLPYSLQLIYRRILYWEYNRLSHRIHIQDNIWPEDYTMKCTSIIPYWYDHKFSFAHFYVPCILYPLHVGIILNTDSYGYKDYTTLKRGALKYAMLFFDEDISPHLLDLLPIYDLTDVIGKNMIENLYNIYLNYLFPNELENFTNLMTEYEKNFPTVCTRELTRSLFDILDEVSIIPTRILTKFCENMTTTYKKYFEDMNNTDLNPYDSAYQTLQSQKSNELISHLQKQVGICQAEGNKMSLEVYFNIDRYILGKKDIQNSIIKLGKIDF